MRRKDFGTVRGRPAPEPVEPPAPLPPVRIRLPRPARVSGVRQGVREALDAYLRVGCGRWMERAEAYALKRSMRVSVAAMLAAGVDPGAYAQHVGFQLARRTRRFPFPEQVFGPAAVERWLPEYKRAEAAHDGATYEASPERLAAYAERMRHGAYPAARKGSA